MGSLQEYIIRSGRLEDCSKIASMINASADGAVDYLFANLNNGLSSLEQLSQQLAKEVHYSYANTLVTEYQKGVVAEALSFPSKGLVLDVNLLDLYDAARQQYVKYFIDNRIEDSWHLDSIFVSDAHRNKGLGKKLLEEVKQQAEYYKFPVLQVFVFGSNKPAIRFYQSNGFEIDAEIDVSAHEFLQDKHQLLRMRFNLKK